MAMCSLPQKQFSWSLPALFQRTTVIVEPKMPQNNQGVFNNYGTSQRKDTVSALPNPNGCFTSDTKSTINYYLTFSYAGQAEKANQKNIARVNKAFWDSIFHLG